MAKNIEKLIDTRIKDSKDSIEGIKTNKKVSLSKMQVEDKQLLREQKNINSGKAKKSGLKWSLEDKIKLKSMYKKNKTLIQISEKLERTTGAVLGELLKSEIITKDEYLSLYRTLKDKINT